MDLSKYAELFLTEGREHISQMQSALFMLELHGADGIAHSDVSAAVAELFRGAHSIKGMAAAMGYERVHDLSHALETLLQGVRTGEDPLTASLITHLFEEADTLARAIENAAMAAEAAANPELKPPVRRSELRSRMLRVDVKRLDALMTLAGELEIARGRLERVARTAIVTPEDDELETAVTNISRLVAELRDQVMTTRMVPAGHVFERFPRLVRETARALGKDVDFVIEGNEIELDRSMLDEIGDPIVHLLRNAIDHGVESPEQRTAQGKLPRALLTLSAQRESDHVLINVSDDGRGIDRARVLARAIDAGLVSVTTTELDDAMLASVLTHSGFSTAETVTEISGRGVGLDVVDSTVRALGGVLEIKSVHHYGTTITLRLPLTVAIIPALLASVDDETFVIPLTHVIETIEILPEATSTMEGRLMTLVRDEMFPLVDVRGRVGRLGLSRSVGYAKAVTVNVRGRVAALVVDDFVGQQDIVVKQFDPPYDAPALFSGATILNDGAPALILDVNALVSNTVAHPRVAEIP